MGLYPVTVGVSILQIIGTCDLITTDTPRITQFLKKARNNSIFLKVSRLCPGVNDSALRRIWGRILLGDNQDCGALCCGRRGSSMMALGFQMDFSYTECPRRNVPDFGRVFLMLNYTDITQTNYVES